MSNIANTKMCQLTTKPSIKHNFNYLEIYRGYYKAARRYEFFFTGKHNE